MRNITTGRKFAIKGGHIDKTTDEILRIPVCIGDVFIFGHFYTLTYIRNNVKFGSFPSFFYPQFTLF